MTDAVTDFLVAWLPNESHSTDSTEDLTKSCLFNDVRMKYFVFNYTFQSFIIVFNTKQLNKLHKHIGIVLLYLMCEKATLFSKRPSLDFFFSPIGLSA